MNDYLLGLLTAPAIVGSILLTAGAVWLLITGIGLIFHAFFGAYRASPQQKTLLGVTAAVARKVVVIKLGRYVLFAIVIGNRGGPAAHAKYDQMHTVYTEAHAACDRANRRGAAVGPHNGEEAPV